MSHVFFTYLDTYEFLPGVLVLNKSFRGAGNPSIILSGI
jgi:hypothetical protein